MTEFTDAQARVERTMAELGASRYWSSVNKAREKSRESTTPAGRYLLREAVGSLEEALAAWVERAAHNAGPKHTATKYLERLDLGVAAVLVAKSVLDSISVTRPFTAAALNAASLLEDECRFAFLRKEARPMWDMLERQLKAAGYSHKRKAIRGTMARLEMDFEPWPKRDRLQLGTVCITLFEEATGLVTSEVVHREGKGNKGVRMLTPTPETLDWLAKSHEQHEALFPFYLPTLCVPADWDDPYDGGYHTNLILRRPLVKAVSKRWLAEIDAADCRQVYGAVNNLQRTGWRVNEYVYATMLHFWEEGISTADLPSQDDELIPSRPLDIDTNEDARRVWRKSAGVIHSRNVAVRSRRLQTAKILYMAREYAGQPFYYPQQLDFRGRIYPVPYFLQPQGQSQARGLLQFADGKPILDDDAERWLAIQGANTFGIDKVSFDARVEWIAKHEPEIRSVHQDPIGYQWWTDASKPWEFLAFCLEWGDFLDQGRGFMSRLPVAQDGSNNGLQIFSLLLRDSVGGAATNCTPNAMPRDIYQDVADLVTERLIETRENAMYAEAREERYLAQTWLLFVENRVPRECAKRPVMTLPYGSTQYSCQKYVVEWYEDELAKGKLARFDEPYAACTYLAALVWDAIGQTVTAAKECMGWLQEVAGVCTSNDVPIEWTAPSGLPIRQRYTDSYSRPIKTTIGDKVRKSHLRYDGNKLCMRRQQNGISPNFVHSIDAAALAMTVNLARERGITSFTMIHDSFGAPAADAAVMARTLREVYARLFAERDLLEEFRAEVQDSLRGRAELPPLPPSGDLDPLEVIDSDYFFA